MQTFTRRTATGMIVTGAAGVLAGPYEAFGKITPAAAMNRRTIPVSGQSLPVVGLGTWQTFDVGGDRDGRQQLREVLLRMKASGGELIDSSPMYGSSEAVVGDLTADLGIQEHFFYATKVWTRGEKEGMAQMENSMGRMRREVMDLMQIHNLVDWKTQMKTLRAWKEGGRIKYWGITHYTDSAHETLARIIREETPDFVQFNYSIRQRNAEKELLEIAKEQHTAVIINQPYDGGSLFALTRGKELPAWCDELEISSWGQYFLKYILGHEAVTCVIPGTSNPVHIDDNMKAGYGRFPDVAQRTRMRNHLMTL